MNQGRIWCVVHPTVGLPLLLGSVALTSLAVHASVMSHTTWMSNYWQGRSKVNTSENVVQPSGKLAALTSVAPVAEPAFAINIAPVPASPGKTDTAFVVTVTPASAPAKAPLVTANSE